MTHALDTEDLVLAGVYFGATAGTLVASTHGGAHGAPIAEGLGRIPSVEVSVIG